MMATARNESLTIQTSADVVKVRQIVRQWAIELGFGLVDQTKIVTAASELARNTVTYGGGGSVELEVLEQNNRQGLRLTFVDRGPGIADIELALKDGYTTGGGLGMGLGGSKRLMNEFHLVSQVGEGTFVRVTKWK
jgi:serine/threonine-protein kinase RsbT